MPPPGWGWTSRSIICTSTPVRTSCRNACSSFAQRSVGYANRYARVDSGKDSLAHGPAARIGGAWVTVEVNCDRPLEKEMIVWFVSVWQHKNFLGSENCISIWHPPNRDIREKLSGRKSSRTDPKSAFENFFPMRDTSQMIISSKHYF